VIYFRVSVIAVSLISGARELGYFSASFRILEVLVGIPGLMVTAAFPIFARSALDDHERFAYAVARVFEVALIVGVWFALSLGLGAAFAIDVVGGSAFRPAVGVLQIQAVGLGGSFVAAVWSVALLSLRRRRELVAISLVALVVGAILVAILASLHGARGAAVGTAVTEVGLAVVGGFVLRRAGRHLVPSLRLLPRVALAAAAACSVLAVPGLGSVPSVVAATIIYFGLLLALRAVPEEVLGELRRRRPGAT
jgi:O-antigen/teichoic acid export membrane protein